MTNELFEIASQEHQKPLAVRKREFRIAIIASILYLVLAIIVLYRLIVAQSREDQIAVTNIAVFGSIVFIPLLAVASKRNYFWVIPSYIMFTALFVLGVISDQLGVPITRPGMLYFGACFSCFILPVSVVAVIVINQIQKRRLANKRKHN